jgi:hypothetical protein
VKAVPATVSPMLCPAITATTLAASGLSEDWSGGNKRVSCGWVDPLETTGSHP